MYDSATQSQCSVTTEWGGMGRQVERGTKREGTYICLMLIHVAIRQKSTKYCEAIILQLKKKNFNFKTTSEIMYFAVKHVQKPFIMIFKYSTI